MLTNAERLALRAEILKAREEMLAATDRLLAELDRVEPAAREFGMGDTLAQWVGLPRPSTVVRRLTLAELRAGLDRQPRGTVVPRSARIPEREGAGMGPSRTFRRASMLGIPQ